MNIREELEERCALERAERLGGLTPGAYEELRRDVHENLSSFVETDTQKAYAALMDGLFRYDASLRGDDMRDDEEFQAERNRRLQDVTASARKALALDPGCLDARLVDTLAQDADPRDLLDSLLELEAQTSETSGSLTSLAASSETDQDAWNDIFLRPRLRLRAATVRACVDTTRYRLAVRLGQEALAASPVDALGIRDSLVLCAARLEDEALFHELETEVRHGNAWWHLARALLLFKLGRMSAAVRALRGYDTLVEGGAYALLRPIYVDISLPDRAVHTPCSFDEALVAVHEAEPIIADTPGFIAWCESQDWLVSSGRRYGDQAGLEWDS